MDWKRFAFVSLVAGCLAVGSAASGVAADGEETSVTGEVLDTACYMAHGRKGAGAAHRKCASECVDKKNFPMALLTEKDEVILVLPDHADEQPYEDLKEYAAKTVTAEGRMFDRGGLKALIISGVSAK